MCLCLGGFPLLTTAIANDISKRSMAFANSFLLLGPVKPNFFFKSVVEVAPFCFMKERIIFGVPVNAPFLYSL